MGSLGAAGLLLLTAAAAACCHPGLGAPSAAAWHQQLVDSSTSSATLPAPTPQFLAELLRQPNSEVHDASTDTVHKIEPANLAHRIIEIRASMSQAMLKFPK